MHSYAKEIESNGPDLRCACYNVHAIEVCMIRA
jgi:hypothetical protein